MPDQGLKIVIGADIKDAQSALKTIVSDSQAAAAKVSSAFGNTPVPLQNIDKYNAAILKLKANISSITFSLPELPALPKSLSSQITLDTSQAATQLNELVAQAQTAEAKVVSLFSAPINIPVKVTAVQAQDVKINTTSAIASLEGLNAGVLSTISEIELLQAQATKKINLISSTTDIADIEKLRIEIELLLAEITRLGNIAKSSFAALNIPLNNIEQYNAAVLALKANIASIKIDKLSTQLTPPAVSISLNTDKAKASLSELVVDAKSAGANVASSFGINLDTSKASAQLKDLVSEAQSTETKVISLFATPISIPLKIAPLPAQDVKINTAGAITNLQGLNTGVRTTEAELAKLITEIELLQAQATKKINLISSAPDIASIEKLRGEIDLLLADITILGNTAKSLPGVTLNTAQASEQLKALTVEARGVGAKVVSILSTPISIPVKVTSVQVPDVKINTTGAVASLQGLNVGVQATESQIAGLISEIELLQSQAAQKLNLISSTNDIVTIEKLRGEIELLLTDITILGNTAKALPGINLNTSPASAQLKALIADAQVVEAKVVSILSTPLNIPVKLTSVQAQDVKINTNSAVTNLQGLNVVVKSTETQLAGLIAEIELLQAEAAKKISLISSSTDIGAIEKLRVEVELLLAEITRLGNSAKSLSGITSAFSGLNIPLNNIEQYNAAVLALKANIESIKTPQLITNLPTNVVAEPRVNISKASAELKRLGVETFIVTTKISKDFASLSLADAIKKLDFFHTSLQRATDPTIIKQFEVSISSLEAHINNLELAGVAAIPPIKTLGNSLETLKGKLASKKELLNTQTDITKIGLLNKQIEQLNAAILRLSNAGKIGFDALGVKIKDNIPAITKLSAQIKKGTANFEVLGKAGKLAGSNLGSLSGVIASTATQMPILANQTTKAASGFLSVAGGASKAFSILRQAAFILPGIGIAGILGGLTDLVMGLFRTGEAANEASKKLKELIRPIQDIKAEAAAGTAEEMSKIQALSNAVLNQTLSYKERNAALNQLKEINKGYFGDLTVETAALGLLKTRVDEYTKALINAAIVKEFSEDIGKLSVELSKQKKSWNELRQPIKGFQEQVDKTSLSLKGSQSEMAGVAAGVAKVNLSKATAAYEKQSVVVGTLGIQLDDLGKSLQEAVNESLKFKPLDDKSIDTKKVSDAFDKFQKHTIDKAKDLAKFFSDTTLFDLKFEVSPLDTQAQTFEKAKNFIRGALEGKTFQALKFGIDVTLDEDFFARTKKQIEAAEKNTIELLAVINPDSTQNKLAALKTADDLTKEINTFTKSNPILLEFEFRKKTAQQKKSAIDSFLGLHDSPLDVKDDKGNDLFTEQEKGALRLAKTVSGVLTPAFDGLFDAIKAGENPMKAFFEGLGQSVLQLIQKLIQAAITAAILSAILPGGGGGFGALFSKFLGLAGGGLVSGPTLAAVGEGSGTSLSNPEVVAPLDQLKAMLGDIGTGGTQVVVMRTQISGNNLALVQARTSRRNQRMGARA